MVHIGQPPEHRTSSRRWERVDLEGQIKADTTVAHPLTVRSDFQVPSTIPGTEKRTVNQTYIQTNCDLEMYLPLTPLTVRAPHR